MPIADIVILISLFFIIIFIIACFQAKNEKNAKNNAPYEYSYSISLTCDSNSYNRSTNKAKRIPEHRKYNIIYNDSPFQDNMNYRLYQCKAVFAKTNRTRTRKIEAFSEDEARAAIKELGYLDPIEITHVPFEPPTDMQRAACQEHGTSIPTKACKADVSYIIDCKMKSDSVPNPELLKYATEMKIKLSYYIGKKALYTCIFDHLEQRDKIAFYVFCVYRFLSNNRCGNLNRSVHKDLFYDFADKKLSDQSFVKSVNRHSGDELRYFGTIYVNNYECNGGGSKNTIAYKETKKFLEENHLINRQ